MDLIGNRRGRGTAQDTNKAQTYQDEVELSGAPRNEVLFLFSTGLRKITTSNLLSNDRRPAFDRYTSGAGGTPDVALLVTYAMLRAAAWKVITMIDFIH